MWVHTNKKTNPETSYKILIVNRILVNINKDTKQQSQNLIQTYKHKCTMYIF